MGFASHMTMCQLMGMIPRQILKKISGQLKNYILMRCFEGTTGHEITRLICAWQIRDEFEAFFDTPEMLEMFNFLHIPYSFFHGTPRPT